MDFVRLAMREVRRNGSRTAIAVVAASLATAVLVLSRIVPQGYMRNQAIAERTFAGGDILVWPAPAHVRLSDHSRLELRAWRGVEWQSYAEYFIPSLPTEGYLSPSSAPPWRPLDVEALSKDLSQIEGVSGVEPYLALPCRVSIGSDHVDAILRGRTVGQSSSSPDAAEQLKSGRNLGPQDEGTMNALIPLQSVPSVPYMPSGELEVSLPLVAQVQDRDVPEVDWASARSWTLNPIGAYTVKVGEMAGARGSDGVQSEGVPLFWERPEIIVTAKTLREMVAATSGSEAPVYQLLVAVSRPSEMKAVADRIRSAIGPDYAVYSIPELSVIRNSGGGQQILTRDMSPVITTMLLTMASAIVAGSAYVLLGLQTKKIGLLRAIGATSKDVLVYALSIIGYTSLLGCGAGFLIGKLVTLTVLAATDFTFLEWLRMVAADALIALFGLAISLALGLAVALWASRIPCAEVLRHE